jgi:NADPH:quinone reductase-like Zn-dependent oxidoreductase
MQAWQIVPGASTGMLRLVDQELPVLGEGEVLVTLRAASLNRRDIYLLDHAILEDGPAPFIPLSDGAGDVAAVGPGVTQWRPGDRVLTTFFPIWLDGPPTEANLLQRGDRDAPGVLRDHVIVRETELVKLPNLLTYAEGATLPCAAGTAWNALTSANLQAGESILILGTGGVALFGAQLAKAVGAQVVLVSRSATKLERLRHLPFDIDAMIASEAVEQWEDRVLEFTEGKGVDLVLEVGGQDTFTHSLATAALGGQIALIGELSGVATQVDILQIRGKLLTLRAMSAGNRAQLVALVTFMAEHAIHPLIDRVFAFTAAPDAFDYLRTTEHIGKVVITIG